MHEVEWLRWNDQLKRVKIILAMGEKFSADSKKYLKKRTSERILKFFAFQTEMYDHGRGCNGDKFSWTATKINNLKSLWVKRDDTHTHTRSYLTISKWKI